MIIIILTLPSKGQLISKGHFGCLQRLVHVVLYVILGHYLGMILQYFGVKIYYYLLF